MKKLLITISLLVLSIILTACGTSTTGETEAPASTEVSVVKHDCFEFDLDTLQFTDNILLSINLTDEFEVSDNLAYQDPTYYIGDFKKKNEAGEVVRTIQVYEYVDPEFSLNENASKISNSWYISKENLDDDSAYIRTFYCVKNDYTIAIDIANNTKEPLTVADSLELIKFLTGEETSTPSKEEENNLISEATLESPASKKDWIATSVYNNISKSYEPVSICIDEIYTGEIAQNTVTEYNNTMKLQDPAFVEYLISNPSLFEYVTFEYSIYFPNNFTMSTEGTADIKLPMSICNLTDNGNGIDGFTNLNNTFVNISPKITNIAAGNVWTEGVCFFEMSQDFDNYLIKIESEDKLSDIKYIRP